MDKREEKTGEYFILSETILYGLFPIIINYGTRSVTPILFAALVTLVGAITMLCYLLITRNFKKVFNKKAFQYILGVTLFVSIIPSILIFKGTSLTSGTNTAILLQTEVFFTFIICGVFLGEKITIQRIIGALVILIGATTVLYQGKLSINLGDILIIAGTFFFPFGNWFAKKALQLTTPSIILFLRAIIGGITLLIIALILEPQESSLIEIANNNLPVLLANGILVFAVSKILWYEGLKRLDISKASALGVSSPAFSLIFAAILLKEIPNYYQIIGVIAIIVGVLITTRKTQTRKIAPGT